MEVILASLISFKVLIYQLGLGGIQVFGQRAGGRVGLIIGYIIVVIWTLSKTYEGLMILQLIIQSGIGYYLLKNIEDE